MVFKRKFHSYIGFALFAGCSVTAAFSAETAESEPVTIEKAAPAQNEAKLMFIKDGERHLIVRASTDPAVTQRESSTTSVTEANAIVAALINGPTAEEKADGVEHFLPPGTTLGKFEIEMPETVRIYLDIPAEFVKSTDYSPRFVHQTGEAFIEGLRDLGFRQFLFYVLDPDSGIYVGIRDLLESPDLDEPAVAPKSENLEAVPQTSDATSRNLPTQNGFVQGALTGKSVVLNQSHGWFDDHDGPQYRWRTQRGRYLEVIEDYGSAMFMNQYVIPLLQNAGARIRPVREPDVQTNMVIVDNADGAPAYTETGSWLSSTANGFIKKAVYTGTNDNPFGQPSGTRYSTGVSGAPTATATYTPQVPADGYYNVYISYSQGANRSTNSHWQVHHSGGVTDFRIDQTKGGGTWVLLENFYFEADAPADQRKIVVLNDSGDSSIISCDAVRLGGGIGNMARRTHGTSGRPRWQEEANNYMQFSGMLASTLMSNDAVNTYDDEQLGWSNRPQFARWEQLRDGLGSNLVYLGWHTNALSGSTCSNGVETGSSARGTGSYRDVDGDATAGTINLTSNVHNAFIQNVRAFYQSNWQDRGIIKSNNYGESSQGNLGTVAGFFFEGLFHDNVADTNAYKDPEFRYIAARGIVQGLISYWGGTVFPPEPVQNFKVENVGNNQVRLSWAAGPVRATNQPYGSAATGFRVYKSTNGFGFDDGTDISNVNEYITALPPGETTYLRVVARNSAGISVPSETLVARTPITGSPTVLVVNGYTRNDRFLQPIITSSGIGGCATPGSPSNTYRTFDPREFQSFNYTVQHGNAIASQGGYGIDSSSKNAVNLGAVSLADYPAVLWIGGQQANAVRAADHAFTPAEMNAIKSYLESGGNLFISGSEIAWDFGRSGASADKVAFLRDYLKANYSADSSNTFTANGNSGIFAGLGTFTYDNGSGNTYQVRFPDVLSPTGGSSASMSYSGGTGGTAAVQYAGTFGTGTQPGKLVYMGFGFETINSEPTRNNVMERVLDFFTLTKVENWEEF